MPTYTQQYNQLRKRLGYPEEKPIFVPADSVDLGESDFSESETDLPLSKGILPATFASRTVRHLGGVEKLPEGGVLKGFYGQPRTDSLLENAGIDFKEQMVGLVDLGKVLVDAHENETLGKTFSQIITNFGPAFVESYTRWVDAAKEGKFLEAASKYPVQLVQDLTMPLSLLSGVGANLAKTGSISQKVLKGIEYGANTLSVISDPIGTAVMEIPRQMGKAALTTRFKKPPVHEEMLQKATTADPNVISNSQVQALEGAAKTVKADQAAYYAAHPEIKKPPELLNAQDLGGLGADIQDLLQNNLEHQKAITEKYVGNLNWKKQGLNSDDDILHVYKMSAEALNDFRGQRRGVVTWLDTEIAAKAINKSTHELWGLAPGTILNNEHLYNARMMGVDAMTDAAKMAAKVKVGTVFDEVEFLQVIDNWLKTENIIAGLKSETGRALNILKKIPTGLRYKDQYLRDLIDEMGGSRNIQKMADIVLSAGSDPAKLGSALKKITTPTFLDKANELFQSNILSGPATMMTNLTSNILNTYAIKGVVDPLATYAYSKLPWAGSKSVTWTETVAGIRGLMYGQKAAMQAGLDSFLTEYNPSWLTATKTKMKENLAKSPSIPGFISETPELSKGKIGGPVGKAVRAPFHVLEGTDTYFKMVNFSSAVHKLGAREAIAQGVKGEGIYAHIADIFANQGKHQDLIEEAWKIAKENTFQSKLGDDWVSALGKVGKGITREIPLMKIVLPFIQTPTNLARQMVERSPLAPTLKSFRDQWNLGGIARDEAMSKMAMGSVMAMGVYMAALDGKITGGDPSKNEKDILRSQGWQPYSVKVGDAYLSFARFDPLAGTIGMAADVAQYHNHMNEKDRQDMASTLAMSFYRTFSQKTYMQGLSTFIEALDQVDTNENLMGNFLKNYASTFFPPIYSNFFNQTARAFDPISREARTLAERIQSRIPTLSDELPARTNLFGDPFNRGGDGGGEIFNRWINPMYMSSIKNDPVLKELTDLRIFPGMPKRSIQGQELTAKEYSDFVKASGRPAKELISQFMDTKDWKEYKKTEVGREYLKERVDSIIQYYRENERYKILYHRRIQEQEREAKKGQGNR